MSRFLRLLHSGGPFRRHGVAGLAWIGLALLCLAPVTQVMVPDLDSSIHATYAYFTAHHFAYGSQINTTAGPYGFIPYGWDYAGELFWVRLAFSVLCALATSALVIWLFRRARPGVTRVAWVASVVFAITIGDNLFALPILLGGIFLLVNYRRPESLRLSLAVVVYLALLGLMKGTQLALAAGVMVSCIFLAVRLRSWNRLFWIGGMFLVALLGWWIAAGQNPAHFLAYLDGIRQISQGYNEAMSLDEPARTFGVGLSLLLLLGGLLGWTAWRHRQDPTRLALTALLAAFTAVLWKHGYVRADGHVYIFLDFGWLAALTVPLLFNLTGSESSRGVRHWISWTLAGVALVVGLGGGELLMHGRIRWLVSSLGERYLANIRYVFTAATVKADRDAELREQAQQHDLPIIKSVVQQHSIDMFGQEMGLLLLNSLHYQPPPMACATYHVYNRHFKQLNRRHFADPTTRPDFILLKTQSIDDRLIAQDDSLSLLALLDLYQPLLTESRALLLKSKGPAAGLQAARVIERKAIRFNEEITVPVVNEDEMLLVAFSLPLSWRGQLQGLVYKSPLVFMNVRGPAWDQPLTRRIIPASMEVPCLLSPFLDQTEDFLSLYTGESSKAVTSFQLVTKSPAAFAELAMEVRFSVVHRPDRVSRTNLNVVYHPSVYQDSPDELIPRSNPVRLVEGRWVQLLPVPSQILYHLRGDERLFSLLVGIEKNAYLEGHTDGVDFRIELQRPGRTPELLNRRQLRPATNPADRGLLPFTVALPPALEAGTRLIVRTDPGEDGNSAWDWSMVTALRFTRGTFQAAQFPGFATLPVSVESTRISRLGVDGRDVTMMGPPSAVRFLLNGTERELRFTAGLIEGSYLQGKTDGVTFAVELIDGDEKKMLLFDRWLRPLTEASDRGPQTMSVKIPPSKPGTQLRLVCDVGPNHNDAWDWAYISELSLH